MTEQEHCPECGRKMQNCPCAEHRAGIIGIRDDGEQEMESLRQRSDNFAAEFNAICDALVGGGGMRIRRW